MVASRSQHICTDSAASNRWGPTLKRSKSLGHYQRRNVSKKHKVSFSTESGIAIVPVPNVELFNYNTTLKLSTTAQRNATQRSTHAHDIKNRHTIDCVPNTLPEYILDTKGLISVPLPMSLKRRTRSRSQVEHVCQVGHVFYPSCHFIGRVAFCNCA